MNEENSFIAVGEVGSFPPGYGRTVEVKGRTLAVFNIAEGFYAIDDRCPHRAASLGAGWVEGCTVYCPMHGWAVDIKTGQCRDVAEKKVTTYPTRVRDNQVEVQLPGT
jgi:NAD(P)H-dependent nitrite reductase small subunit